MSAAITALLVSLLINFLINVFGGIIEFILITQTLIPTDVFSGLLDVNSEIFTAWLPQINWFVPLDYAVTLFGAFVDAYASYIIYLYVKRILTSIFSGGSFTNILAAFLK